uniref:Ig-like domain-containing protein n=1 Tax=Knipowitschia caucasica TaxID=637954 RepID=A0AAV2IU06_KNICA
MWHRVFPHFSSKLVSLSLHHCSFTASAPVDKSSPSTSSGHSTLSSLPSSIPFSAKAHTVQAQEVEVRLLPPLLRDQAWGVHAQEAFMLFCLALGPSDVHVHWLMDGHAVDRPVMEERRVLAQGQVLVSSWLQEGPLIKEAQYQCVAETGTGQDRSEAVLSLPGAAEDLIPEKYLSQWRSALAEHGRLLKKWEAAWETCSGR